MKIKINMHMTKQRIILKKLSQHIIAYSVPRTSSQRKFKILSFLEESNISYPSPFTSKEFICISSDKYWDSEMYLVRDCNQDSPATV